jgi:hypothetical protein
VHRATRQPWARQEETSATSIQFARRTDGREDVCCIAYKKSNRLKVWNVYQRTNLDGAFGINPNTIRRSSTRSAAASVCRRSKRSNPAPTRQPDERLRQYRAACRSPPPNQVLNGSTTAVPIAARPKYPSLPTPFVRRASRQRWARSRYEQMQQNGTGEGCLNRAVPAGLHQLCPGASPDL